MQGAVLIWSGFLLFVGALLALDLFVLNRKAHVIGAREAIGWTAMWAALALLFGVGLYFLYEFHVFGIGKVIGEPLGGRQAATLFVTGYLIEQSLSLDNLFVIATIFGYFKVPAERQHRVLFWGILGAIVLRGVMIVAGVALVHRFEPVMYFFGALLIFSAGKMLLMSEHGLDLEHNLVVRAARRLFRVSPDYEGEKFWTRIDGKRYITPLLLVLFVVEAADVVFAVDSIPAIFGITTDPFIIFTSNVFAILGLRSMYFALAAVMGKFRLLKVSLAFILAFVGVKMILARLGHDMDALLSLAVIVIALLVGVAASVIEDRRRTGRDSFAMSEVEQAARLMVRRARKIVIFVIGATVMLLAIPVGLLPGPGGIFVVILGLMILATEFVWARRWLRKTKEKARQMLNLAERGAQGAYRVARSMVGLENAAVGEADKRGQGPLQPRQDE